MKRMKTIVILTVATAWAGLAWPSRAAEVSLESAPPVVVQTLPVAGTTAVDPALTEIRVTFSKAMQDGSWSWSTWGEENFPELVGQPHYLPDGRTCVIKVKLQPGKFYATWLNSEQFKSFRDAHGQPAVPYLLTFTTAVGALDYAARVSEAINTISQCAEGDPRVTAALASLQSVPSAPLVTELVPYLDSPTDTRRRSAIYVFWRGHLAEISAAVPALLKLLSHPEDLTRGMAALALGQNRVRASLAPLCAMTRDDESAYARRCGAYALGLLGDPQARPVLEQARKDSEPPVRQNAEAALKMLEQAESAKSPPVRTGALVTPAPSKDTLLNDNQRAVLDWTDRQFRSYFDARTFDGWSAQERSDLETRLIDALKGPQSREYFQAINTLGALHSSNALPALRTIAYDRADKSNRDRWMAIRSLGLIGDPRDVPELIRLVYHGNVNTRWWAQISLVRLTGQNFGKDWHAWGQWWQEQKGQPPYQAEIIRWWNGQAEPDKLAESLDEGDRKFLADLKPKS